MINKAIFFLFFSFLFVTSVSATVYLQADYCVEGSDCSINALVANSINLNGTTIYDWSELNGTSSNGTSLWTQNGTDISYGTGNVYIPNRLTIQGLMVINALTQAENINPILDDTYSLGNTTHRWAEIHTVDLFADNIDTTNLSTDTITLNGETITDWDEINQTTQDPQPYKYTGTNLTGSDATAGRNLTVSGEPFQVIVDGFTYVDDWYTYNPNTVTFETVLFDDQDITIWI